MVIFTELVTIKCCNAASNYISELFQKSVCNKFVESEREFSLNKYSFRLDTFWTLFLNLEYMIHFFDKHLSICIIVLILSSFDKLLKQK